MPGIDAFRERLAWRAHEAESATIAAEDYFDGVVEQEDVAELNLRKRRALWERWMQRVAVGYLAALSDSPDRIQELSATWDWYERHGEQAVQYAMVPAFEEWVDARMGDI
jgi:hypothetical protein